MFVWEAVPDSKLHPFVVIHEFIAHVLCVCFPQHTATTTAVKSFYKCDLMRFYYFVV